jgi:hypothetical protein
MFSLFAVFCALFNTPQSLSSGFFIPIFITKSPFSGMSNNKSDVNSYSTFNC